MRIFKYLKKRTVFFFLIFSLSLSSFHQFSPSFLYCSLSHTCSIFLIISHSFTSHSLCFHHIIFLPHNTLYHGNPQHKYLQGICLKMPYFILFSIIFILSHNPLYFSELQAIFGLKSSRTIRGECYCRVF